VRAQVEALAAPVIACFFYNEVPASGVIIGGLVVLAALVLQAFDREPQHRGT